MELLEGIDLETLVRRFGPQPPARVVRFLCQACHSLAEAHSSGLVHRDIKPANLYLSRLGLEYDFVKVSFRSELNLLQVEQVDSNHQQKHQGESDLPLTR